MRDNGAEERSSVRLEEEGRLAAPSTVYQGGEFQLERDADGALAALLCGQPSTGSGRFPKISEPIQTSQSLGPG